MKHRTGRTVRNQALSIALAALIAGSTAPITALAQQSSTRSTTDNKASLFTDGKKALEAKDFKKAEILFKQSLAIQGTEVDDFDPLINLLLAQAIEGQGRKSEAEALSMQAALNFGKSQLDSAKSEDGENAESPQEYLVFSDLLAKSFASIEKKNWPEASAFLQNMISISDSSNGIDQSYRVLSRIFLVLILEQQNRLKEAEPISRQALNIAEQNAKQNPGDEDGLVVTPLLALARIRALTGFPGDGETLALRALGEVKKTSESTSPMAASAYETLALAQLAKGQFGAAAISAASALEIQRKNPLQGNELDEADVSRSLVEQLSNAGQLLMRAAWAARQAGDVVSLRSSAFDAAQSIGITGSGRALLRSASRASLDAKGQALARTWDEALAKRGAIEKQWATLMKSLSSRDSSKSAELKSLAAARDSARDAATKALNALTQYAPRYTQLLEPTNVSLAELQQSVAGQQALLGADEALILITPGYARMPRGQQRGVVFAVTRDGVAWGEIGIDPEALVKDITGLRQLLDSGGSTRAPGSGGPQTGAQRGYDRATARRLYDALFGAPEIAKLIAGKKEWIISPQGALLSLPFAALVAGDYSGDDADVAALRSTPWLGMTKALSVIPEVSSLRALRGLSRPARSTQTPFFGMGDPDFARGATGAAPATVAAVTPAGAKRGAPAIPDQVRAYFRDAGADISAVSSLARLPGTKIEIETLAKSLGAIPGSILLGDDATEKNLRARSSDGSLARAKVVAFATHGLIAGDLGRSLAQPALAFTPPAPAEGAVTETNDGLLTAGEAATLKLAADWVILSACNTAAGGGDKSADGLTGLARAFFYAGADSLLVSHWRVRDEAAARLTTRAVEIAATPGSQRISRAAALQQSMRELMNDASQDGPGGDSFAHPAAWAPFALIGAERLQRN